MRDLLHGLRKAFPECVLSKGFKKNLFQKDVKWGSKHSPKLQSKIQTQETKRKRHGLAVKIQNIFEFICEKLYRLHLTEGTMHDVTGNNHSGFTSRNALRSTWRCSIMLSVHSLLKRGGKTRAHSEENDQRHLEPRAQKEAGKACYMKTQRIYSAQIAKGLSRGRKITFICNPVDLWVEGGRQREGMIHRLPELLRAGSLHPWRWLCPELAAWAALQKGMHTGSGLAGMLLYWCLLTLEFCGLNTWIFMCLPLSWSKLYWCQVDHISPIQ